MVRARRKRRPTGGRVRRGNPSGGRSQRTLRGREAVTVLVPATETAALRAWAEVDLRAIAHTLGEIRARLAPSARVMAMEMADANGCAFVHVCEAVLKAGASAVGVAPHGEGVELRLGGIRAPILVLGGLTVGEVADAAAHQLSISITSQERAQLILERPQRLPTGVHLKVDTGMTRLGVFRREVQVLLARLVTKGVSVAGCYTQLASADQADHAMTSEQLARFHPVLAVVRARFPRVVVHVANSAGALASPDTHFDMARVGLAMYGLYPSSAMRSLASLRPAMRLYSRVVRTARVGPGTTVSYGAAYRTQTSTTIATIACGYADGYPRLAGETGEVIIRGMRHKVAGRVSMDHLMGDVGDHPVAVGDVVQLFGDAPSADEVAAYAHTISYEVLS